MEGVEAAERVDPLRYRPDIEGLRGLAVLLVVAYHAEVRGVRGGYVGVDVFFVLSGYLISGLLLQEFEDKKGISFRRFYARRIRRLLPASTVVFLSTILVGLLLYSPLETRRFSLTASSTAVYVSNLFFAERSTVYLDQTSGADPFLHTWSLAVEEQFYALWPLAILLAAGAGRRWGSARSAVTGMMMLLFAGSFASCIWLTRWNQPLAFFISLSRFWEFAVGGLAAMVPAVWLSRRNVREAASGLGVILIAAAVLGFDDRSSFPGQLALVPVLGTALVLLAGASDGTPLVVRVLSREGFLWLGRHSYSWYLWHWPTVVFAGVLWSDLSVWGRVLAMASALVLSDLTLRLLENPVRYSRWLKGVPVLCIGAALATTALSFGTSLAVFRGSLRQLSTPAQAQAVAVSRDLPDINARGCVLEFRVTAPNGNCTFGDTASATIVVLFGDSHAGQLFPAVEAVALARHWRLDVYVKAACPSAKLVPEIKHSSLGRTYTECTRWRSKVIDEISRKQPAIVVTSNSNAYIDPDGGMQYFGISADDWQRGIQTTIGTFESRGIDTVLVADTLRPGFDVPTCLSRLAVGKGPRSSCAFDRSASLNPVLRHAESEAIGNVPGSTLVDLNDALCTEALCPVRRGDLFIYRDSNHMTASFSRSLAPILMRSLPEITHR